MLLDWLMSFSEVETAKQRDERAGTPSTVTSSLEGFPSDSLASLHDVRISSATTDSGQTDDARSTHRVSTSGEHRCVGPYMLRMFVNIMIPMRFGIHMAVLAAHIRLTPG